MVVYNPQIVKNVKTVSRFQVQLGAVGIVGGLWGLEGAIWGCR